VEAETVFRTLLPDMRVEFEEDNPRYLGYLRGLIEVVRGQGRRGEAKNLCEKGLAIVEQMRDEQKDEESVAMIEVQKKLEGRRNSGE
jgi:hypothetical protein